MGVCCSKDKVVKIRETSGTESKEKALLIEENVGPGGGTKAICGNLENGHENNPHIPVIKEPQGVQTQEAETVNSYNKQDDSAARSTLIFPSYSGYRNQDPFGVSKKTTVMNTTPTAFVSPFRSNPGSFLNSSGSNTLGPKSSPLPSRYSPMLNSSRDHRIQTVQPRVFERRLANSRRESVESGGFNSDLESDTDEAEQNSVSSEIPVPNIITSELNLPLAIEKDFKPKDDKSNQFSEDLKKKNDMGIGTENTLSKEKQDMEIHTEESRKTNTSTSVGTDSETKSKHTASTGTETSAFFSPNQTTATIDAQTSRHFVNMVDASVGTENDDFYRSTKSKEVLIDPTKKKPLQTSSSSTGTDMDFEQVLALASEKSDKKRTHDMNVGTDPMTTDSSSRKSKSKAKKKEKQFYVKMVDASVGTENDDFYRSTKSKEVLIDPTKKKPLQTSSSSTGTDMDFGHVLALASEKSDKKRTHDMNVGTDPMTTDSSSRKSKSKAKKKEKQFYVKLVDVSVGTDSDDFYRSKKTRKVQISSKEKNTTSFSTGIGTSTEPSSNPKPNLSTRIVVENVGTSPNSRKKNAATNSPSASPRKQEKAKPHPIIETLEDAFTRFAKYGDINYDGKAMNNKNWAKLCRDCEFIDNKHVLVGEVDVIFMRHKPKGHRLIDFEMFKNCLNEIADKTFSHKIEDEWTRREIVYRNVIGKAPEMIGITGTSKTGNVDRMTDHNLYPVSHKMRFDEDGRGLGIEEKFEIHDSHLGYVQGYKERDTYDQKMLGITREKSGINMNSGKLSPRLFRRPVSSGSNRSSNI